MLIRGKLYDGRTSAALAASMELSATGSARLCESLSPVFPEQTLPLKDLKISPRIGDTPRRITLPNGAVFETNYNEEVDDWLGAQRRHGFAHQVSRLERHWLAAIAALGITLLSIGIFIRFGLPIIAKFGARTAPIEVDAMLGSKSLAALDRTIFDPTELAEDRQIELRARFKNLTASLDAKHAYSLEFRRGWRIGPNAFALPSGIVVVTDQLVELADDDRELDAVLVHEIGHVVNRHALRTLLQGSASGAVIAAVLGDFTSVSNLIAAAPAVLVQARYSRDLETEADDFAYAWMERNNLPTHYFGDMLAKVEAGSTTKSGRADRSDSAFDFLSSHPRTRDRIREK